MPSFHAGSRYSEAVRWIKEKHRATNEEIANALGISYPQSTRYNQQEKFGSKMSQNLVGLKKWGINLEYFLVESAPMLLKGFEEEEEEKQGIADIIEELEAQSLLIERLATGITTTLKLLSEKALNEAKMQKEITKLNKQVRKLTKELGNLQKTPQ